MIGPLLVELIILRFRPVILLCRRRVLSINIPVFRGIVWVITWVVIMDEATIRYGLMLRLKFPSRLVIMDRSWEEPPAAHLIATLRFLVPWTSLVVRLIGPPLWQIMLLRLSSVSRQVLSSGWAADPSTAPLYSICRWNWSWT